jgi:hypothetical protein
VDKKVIRFGFVIPISLFAIACSSSLALAADAPSADTLKRVLGQQLQKLRPVGFTERNVLFQEVRAGTPGARYWFQVTATIRDYGPGYPANHYYGETCVGHMDKSPFELVRDEFGEWEVQGKMSLTTSDGRQCKPNPSAGVTSIPLTTLAGSPAPAGPAAAPPPPAPAAGKPTGLSTGKDGAHGSVTAKSYACVFYIDSPSSTLQTVPGFTIKAGGKYMDADGKNGTYTFDPAQALITFHGGSMNGNAARYDGRVIHIYNEKRTRTVIDCD